MHAALQVALAAARTADGVYYQAHSLLLQSTIRDDTPEVVPLWCVDCGMERQEFSRFRRNSPAYCQSRKIICWSGLLCGRHVYNYRHTNSSDGDQMADGCQLGQEGLYSRLVGSQFSGRFAVVRRQLRSRPIAAAAAGRTR